MNKTDSFVQDLSHTGVMPCPVSDILLKRALTLK